MTACRDSTLWPNGRMKLTLKSLLIKFHACEQSWVEFLSKSKETSDIQLSNGPMDLS